MNLATLSRSVVIANLRGSEDADEPRVRDSGTGDGYTIRGHAAVYNKLSLDLGGFQEKIAPGAFDRSLAGNPDVLAVWDHDTRYILARTMNNTLELRSDPYGLHCWMRVAPTSYASDLRLLMERGDITQASFMFTIERESWAITERADGSELIVATVEEVKDLYDVTVCGRGAYPQADMAVAQGARMRQRLTTALHEGRVPGLTLDEARSRGLVTEDPAAEPVRPAAEDGIAPVPKELVTADATKQEAARAHAQKIARMQRNRSNR